MDDGHCDSENDERACGRLTVEVSFNENGKIEHI